MVVVLVAAVVVVTLGASLGLSNLLHDTWQRCYPTALFLPLLAMVVFGLMNLLVVGEILAAVWFIGLTVLAIGHLIRHQVRLPWEMALVAATLVTNAWLVRGLRFFGMDEFTHWGRIAKLTATRHQLGPWLPADLAIPYRSYPPGAQLLPTLLADVRGGFLESDVFFAMGVLCIACLVPLLGQWGKQTWLTLPAFVVAVVVLSSVFQPAYARAYADSLLGFLFGCALLVVVTACASCLVEHRL